MQIQVNAAHNIEGHAALSVWANELVKNGLNRYSEHITRVEVHLTDENGAKSGPDDKCCVIEARLEGRPPIAVTHHAATLRQAADGARVKLTRMLESTLGRLRDKKRHTTTEPFSPGPKLTEE